MSGRVLVVDDDPRIVELVALELANADFETVSAGTGKEALDTFQELEPDVVLLDLHLPDVTGIELLSSFRRTAPDVPIVMLTAQGGVETVVECMRQGAVDYVQKPFDATRLVTSVRNARHNRALATQIQSLTSELRKGEGFDRILGGSDALQRSLRLLRRAADSDVTVLIQGESGTGKEVAARALHAECQRRSGPFVAVNCGAIPEGLIESELFGHEKGAFTGADERRAGRFEQANGGTVFLDEIGELRLDLQVRLLRVLQERTVQRIGASAPRKVDLRVLAATNRDLRAEVKGGDFREDLFYRLAVFPVLLPPLRDRDGDVGLLADAFLQRFARHHGRRIQGFTPTARHALLGYAWPGNVRELENVIERAVILEDGQAISLGSLPDEVVDVVDPAVATARDAGAPRSAEAPPSSSRRPRSIDDIRPLADEERNLILEALELTSWNIVDAARRLGIGRATIYRKIERYGLRG